MNTKPTSLEALSLNPNSESDYVLNPAHSSVWITVGNISIYLRRHDEGVSVDLYPVQQSDSNSLAGTWLTFAEACREDE